MNPDILILKAALDPPQSAIAAWQAWYDAGNIELLQGASHRLMPLVHTNLVKAGYNGPELDRIKGMRRRLWVEAEQRIHNALPFLRELQLRHGRLILLKGAPLAALYYRDFGLRPMADLDLLVEEQQALAIIAELQQGGWQIVIEPTPLRLDEEFLTFRHGAGFRGPKGVELDIHWRMSYFGTRPGIDTLVREAAEPFELRGWSTWTLAPTDHLFHAMIHGVQYNPFPASRWVADAVTLIRNPRGIDWQRLRQLALHYDVTPYIALAAQILREQFHIDVPPLEFPVPSWWLRQEFRRETTNWFSTSKPVFIASTLHRYRRTGASFWNLGRLARFCQFQWDLTTPDGWRRNWQRFRG